ncbi:TspO/MBR family protein [Flavobacterium humi]|uniref:Tryptophan-rich sensory protein n=1 Tax=Flavobacterium humi TaxID=2562683 RepID=A0A4Z0L850_9FLAO|nr:TspO/MBR family protein [Flavobacterium humi]TGD57320.1 tryptophan-rich sensory protein [Flavobacterium humi]
MKKINYSRTIISMAVCSLIGVVSGYITQSSVTIWFSNIEKPFFNPPHWTFIPVWIILHVLMGYSFAQIWSREPVSPRSKKIVNNAMIIFGIQLALNFLWTYIFFALCNPFLALIEILLLWLFIFETIKAFYVIDRYAARLLLPQLAWASFSAVLNGAIWWLNC